MPSIFPAIAAQVLGPAALQPPHGKGVVERQTSETTFRIRFRSGAVAVKVPPGALRQGDTVIWKGEWPDGTLEKAPGSVRSLHSQWQASVGDTFAAPIAAGLASRFRISAMLAGLLSAAGEAPDVAVLRNNAAALTREMVSAAGGLSEREMARVWQIIAEIEKLSQAPDAAAVENLRDSVQEAIRFLAAQHAPAQLRLPPAAGITPGLYYFETSAGALLWLEKAGVSTAPSLPDAPGAVIVGVKANAEGLDVVFYTKADAGSAIQAILREYLRSDVWRMLDSETLAQILQNQKSLLLPRLLLADSLLIARLAEQSAQPTARLCLEQWVRIIADPSISLGTALAHQPLPTAKEIVAQYQAIRQSAIDAGIGVQGPAANDLVFDPSGEKGTGETLIEIPRRMGITLEHDLISQEVSPQTTTPVAGVTAKAALLAALQQTIALGDEAQPFAASAGPAALAQAGTVPRLVASALPLIDAAVAFLSELQPAQKRPPANNESSIVQQTPAAAAAFATADADRATMLPAVTLDGCTQWISSASYVTHALEKALSLLSRLLASEPTMTRLSEALVKALIVRLELVQNAALDAEAMEKATPQYQSTGTRPMILAPESAAAYQALERLIEALRFLARDPGAGINTEHADTVEAFARLLERHLGRLLTELKIGEGMAQRDMLAPSAGSLRQSADVALGLLESIQLLSRPVATADATAQVIAIPFKIGGELTEVRMKLIKKRHVAKNGPRAARYAVTLSVSPSFLGDVEAAMEYIPQRHLRLRMDCGREGAYAWFAKHRAAMSGSMQALGLPAPVVDVCRLDRGERRRVAADQVGPTEQDKAKIDLRA